MSATDRLDEIRGRYVEWHQDRGDHTAAPNTETWADADHPDESMEHCIARNDVPAMMSALWAVLDLHKPVELGPSAVECSECADPKDSHWGAIWPCPTVRAVEVALGVTA